MLSNLGRNLEESINKKVNSAEMKKAVEIAKKMLRRGTSVDIVAEDTELSIEEVENIKGTLVN
ncbi:hypothetical protein [Clostridium tagluense]|uniref:hypothetical protein n=1 Tax=Clostridium tagluense TaxID=360422 RepID=UPI001C6E1D34|nr:hypothetical protein [Clostridium tagluense]MBW9158641.1 hypothetical protein [Clostridium tagluense]WLC68550.1 hypothetical protein KTC93_26090 [Clostridium tagluense]